jgi:hypothetical protein
MNYYYKWLVLRCYFSSCRPIRPFYTPSHETLQIRGPSNISLSWCWCCWRCCSMIIRQNRFPPWLGRGTYIPLWQQHIGRTISPGMKNRAICWKIFGLIERVRLVIDDRIKQGEAAAINSEVACWLYSSARFYPVIGWSIDMILSGIAASGLV